MLHVPRLYERAVPDRASFDSLWDINNGKTFFTGPLYYNANHQHGAPVFLAGIYGSFRLRVQGGDWLSCRTAVIPAGVLHELDLGGDPLSVFYIEPTIAGVHALLPLIKNTCEVNGALAGGGTHAIVFAETKFADTPVGRDVLVLFADRLAAKLNLDLTGFAGQLFRGHQLALVAIQSMQQADHQAAGGSQTGAFQGDIGQHGDPDRRLNARAQQRLAHQSCCRSPTFWTISFLE